jgi:hypothetical protein
MYSLVQVVSSASCKGVGKPLDKTSLRQLARQVRPGASENRIGRMFENFVIESRGDTASTRRYPSPERTVKTGGKLSNVVLDSVSSVIQVLRIFGVVPITPLVFDESSFMDSKAYKEKKVIKLNNSIWQSLGYLDYLGHNSQAARSILTRKLKPTPHMLYATTSDVSVDIGNLNYNGGTSGPVRTPVAVWQQVACQVQPGRNSLQMGRALWLNPYRFTGRPGVLRVSSVRPGIAVPLRP